MRKNMRNLAKYAAHICGIYAAYAAYNAAYFPAYFRYANLSDGRVIII